MRTILDIGAVILLLQGFAPLVQEAAGVDSSASLFVTNQVPELMPWAGLLLGAAGVAMLVASVHLRRRERAVRV
ncbi:MAG TPA: hypothetical protein VNP20_03615 [Nocardioidaceae bacterium]|nr:hypothetical protein [Nocardioidaceae bacterium]